MWLLAAAFLLVEIVVLPGAASPFRAPKEVVALSALLAVVGLSAAAGFARGRLTLRWSPAALVLLALPVLQALSMLWSGSPRLALDAALSSAIWVSGALWLATTGGPEHRRLVDAAAIGAAVSALVMFAQAAGAAVFAIGLSGPTGRLALTGLTGNPADLAAAAVLLLPLVLAAPECSPGERRFRHFLAVLLTGAAVVSQTMTALVAVVLVWGLWLVQRRSRRLWVVAAATVLALIAVGLATGLDDRIRRQIRRLEMGDWYFLLSARSDGWTAAGEMVRGRPLIGTGAANFTHSFYPSRLAFLDRTGAVGNRAEFATHFRFAHCDPLQMTAELGVLGLLWMAALAAALLRAKPRGDPLPALAVAAFLPFLLFHFPTHLAVGLVPTVLVLGRLLSGGREIVVEPAAWRRRVGVAVAIALVLAGVYWQLHKLIVNLWRGGLGHALATIERLEPSRRATHAAAVEGQILARIEPLASAQPWLWRMVGQARMARGDGVGAETAFRRAMGLWPHEEAEFGLGLALADQDRRRRDTGNRLDARNLRGEAIVHLARVCRTNPALLELIADDDLRRAVTEIVVPPVRRQAPGQP